MNNDRSCSGLVSTLAWGCLAAVVVLSTFDPGTVSLAQELEKPTNCAEPYEATWESLREHSSPEWFRDAKFGIYTHWGPVSIGAENAKKGSVQWYGMGMYLPKDPAFKFHREKFGDQSEFGYKDVVSLFKAEKFDAEA